MLKAFVLIAGSLLVGCSSLDSIGLRYTLWKAERRSAQQNSAYQKAVGQQAREEQLLGTWHRRYKVASKKLFSEDHTQALSLFSDGTYALRHTKKNFVTNIKTTTGTWQQTGPGVIRQQPDNDDKQPFDTHLSAWANAFVDAERSLHDAEGTPYHATLLQDEAGTLPIVVFHACDEALVAGFTTGQMFNGSFVPRLYAVQQADAVLMAKLEQDKPGKAYLRQYAGFRANGKAYLWVQLTAERVLRNSDDDALDAWDTASFLNGFIFVNDGGDDFGEAVYDVEAGEIATLAFNGDV
ncbi:MAG: hypothetical protein ACE37H_13580 [Phycisphaeraceae bacterium]